MKAIFASLNLDDGQSSVPPVIKKEEGISTDVAVASEGPGSMGSIAGEGDAYGQGFDDGQGYWNQAGGSYGLPQ
jgi:hypothetical protein